MRFTHRILSLPAIAAIVFVALAAITIRGNIEHRELSEQLEEGFFADLELSLRLENSALLTRQAFLNAVNADEEFGVLEAVEHAAEFHDLLESGRANPRLDAVALDSLAAVFDGYVQRAVPAVEVLTSTEFEDITEEQLGTIVEMNAQYEELERVLAERTAQSRAEVDAATANSRERQAKRRKAATIASIAGLLVLILVSAAVIASVLGPLRTIMSGTEAIAAGDLYQRIDYESKDQLGRVAESFRKMQRSLLRDTNERKRAESALRSSQERLALAFEAANDGLWDFSIADDELYLSPRYFAILGYPESDARSIPPIPRLCRPHERARVDAAWRSHITDGTPIDIELEVRRRDGEWRRIQARGRIAELHADGRPRRSIGTITEITHVAPETTSTAPVARGGRELVRALGRSLSPLLSSAELVVAAPPDRQGSVLELLESSRARALAAYSAASRVSEFDESDTTTLREAVDLASCLSGREIEVAGNEAESVPALEAVRRIDSAVSDATDDPARAVVRSGRAFSVSVHRGAITITVPPDPT